MFLRLPPFLNWVNTGRTSTCPLVPRITFLLDNLK
jgi:hypothetical protein